MIIFFEHASKRKMCFYYLMYTIGQNFRWSSGFQKIEGYMSFSMLSDFLKKNQFTPSKAIMPLGHNWTSTGSERE